MGKMFLWSGSLLRIIAVERDVKLLEWKCTRNRTRVDEWIGKALYGKRYSRISVPMISAIYPSLLLWLYANTCVVECLQKEELQSIVLSDCFIMRIMNCKWFLHLLLE